jgi:hypothetical protein
MIEQDEDPGGFAAQQAACQRLRRAAMKAVTRCVKWLESQARTEWETLEYLAGELTNEGITDYWYPAGEEVGSHQQGIIVLFDHPADPQRTLFENARRIASSKTCIWHGLGYFYVSPFSLAPIDESHSITAVGDFAVSIYTGRDPRVANVFRRRWQMQEEILASLSEGRVNSTSKLFQCYLSSSGRLGLKNTAVTVTGPQSGQESTNIGHSIPRVVVSTADSGNSAKRQLSQSRRFVDPSSDFMLGADLWTIESRDRSEGYPFGMVSFHDIVSPARDGMGALTKFPDFFLTIGMEWILNECELREG